MVVGGFYKKTQGWLTLKGAVTAQSGAQAGYVDFRFEVHRIEIMSYNAPLQIDRARPIVLVRDAGADGQWAIEGTDISHAGLGIE